eukprot:g24818.t1
MPPCLVLPRARLGPWTRMAIFLQISTRIRLSGCGVKTGSTAIHMCQETRLLLQGVSDLWENIVIAGISLGTAWLVHFEAEHWNLAPNLIGQLLLMLAAGGTAALAAHSGFEGSQVLIGAVLGFLGAVYCGIASWAQSADGALPGFALSWYCAGSAFGVWVFTSWRKPLLATLAPLFGSYLVVTGIGSLLSHSLDLPVLPQHGAPWSLGALVLLGPLGLSALPWYGACALLAASLHGCKRPTIAVMVLVAYIVLVALGALVAGMECHRDGKRSDGSDCPKMLAVPGQWKWQLLGCSAWAVLAAWCGYRQLSALKQKTSRYMPVEEAVEAPEEADPFVTRVPPQAYAPQGYAPQTYAPYQAGGLYKYVQHFWEFCRLYFESKGIDAKATKMMRRLTDALVLRDTYWHEWNRVLFMNDIEITKLSWFQSERYQDFFQFLDSVGGFWLYRWGDHAVRTIAIALFLDPDLLMRMQVPYGHQNTCRCGGERPEEVCVRASTSDWWRCIHRSEVSSLPPGLDLARLTDSSLVLQVNVFESRLELHKPVHQHCMS